MCRRTEIVNAPPLGGAPSPCSLTYLSKSPLGDIGARRRLPRQPLPLEHLVSIDGRQQLSKFIELENFKLFTRQDSLHS